MPQFNNDKERKARQERKLLELLGDIRSLLRLPAGRRFFLAALEETNVFGPSWAPGDQSQTGYNEGVRAVGLRLKTILEAAEKGAVPKMLLEQMHLPGGRDGRCDEPDESHEPGGAAPS
ncbi:MAG: hypothetical protein LBV79_06810 [Candidatus Adiutrix sp.]|jgi:hypothetical protein|nr:hypothetical protein [Candidatus Adiutrix sp.]